MCSNLQASEEVIEFHATKVYLNLGLIKVQYNNNNNNNNNDDDNNNNNNDNNKYRRKK
jgi:hypothetical protein